MLSKPSVSKLDNFSSRREWEEFLWGGIVEKLLRSNSAAEIKKMLGLMISPKEREFILKRITVPLLLADGLTYSQISELLWLSPTTISTIKKNLRDPKGLYLSSRKFLHQKRKYSGRAEYFETKQEKFWSSLWKDISELRLGGAYTDASQRWNFLKHNH
ncbi:MAG: Trp family transcriptional regulator [Patescibacteria group bacterium]